MPRHKSGIVWLLGGLASERRDQRHVGLPLEAKDEVGYG